MELALPEYAFLQHLPSQVGSLLPRGPPALGAACPALCPAQSPQAPLCKVCGQALATHVPCTAAWALHWPLLPHAHISSALADLPVPLQVAAAAVLLAQFALGGASWTATLEHYTLQAAADLEAPASRLLAAWRQAQNPSEHRRPCCGV